MNTFDQVKQHLAQLHAKINAKELAGELTSLHKLIEELQEEYLGLKERVQELERQIAGMSAR